MFYTICNGSLNPPDWIELDTKNLQGVIMETNSIRDVIDKAKELGDCAIYETVLPGSDDDSYRRLRDLSELESQMEGFETISDSDFNQYLQTVLWSCNDESTPSGGSLLNKNYDVDDFNSSGAANQREDCKNFLQDNAGIIAQLLEEHKLSTILHDFWLSRNDYGVGFCDGGYPKPVDKILNESAKIYGGVDVYVGDDDIIHFM